MADKKWTVVRMPETDVRLIIPEGVELFCMVGYEKDGKGEMECCKAGSQNGIEVSFPLMAIIDGLKRLPTRAQVEGARFAILEIAKTAGLGIVQVAGPKGSFEETMRDLSKELNKKFGDGGEQE